MDFRERFLSFSEVRNQKHWQIAAFSFSGSTSPGIWNCWVFLFFSISWNLPPLNTEKTKWRRKPHFLFAFRSLIRRSATLGDAFGAWRRKNFDFRRNYFHSEMKTKKIFFALHFAHLFVTLRLKSRSFSISAEKRKEFLLFCTRFFVTLEEISNHLCLSEVWEITQFSRLRFGNLLISVFCRDMRIVRALYSEPPACFNGSLSGAKVYK